MTKLLNILLIVLVIFSSLCVHAFAAPTPPRWSDKWNADFMTKVRDWPSFEKPGHVWYSFSEHDALRADYYHWCIPLFDDPATLKKSWNFTCTFLQRFEATYFISEPNEIIDVPCCIFEPHLPPVRPDWLKECNYTGTEMADGVLCHKWWFYESQDLYYGFWYAVGPKPTPVRFLGLSTLGETTLEYSNYQNNTLSGDGDKIFKIPDNCNTICDPKMNKSRGKHSQHLAGVFGTLLIP